MWQSIFSISAEDRVGHVTQVSSDAVIIDTTTPTIGHLAIGTITQERFVSAKELPVHWDGVGDKESGIKHLEVSVNSLVCWLCNRFSFGACALNSGIIVSVS